VSDAAVDARIRELGAKLARATHARDEYRKLYELVMIFPRFGGRFDYAASGVGA
jgi:hypothetical protein